VKVQLLRRIAHRCDAHDRASSYKIRALELALAMEPSEPSGDFVDQHADLDLIDCGNNWCRRHRT
jgi:hypothetical protein